MSSSASGRSDFWPSEWTAFTPESFWIGPARVETVQGGGYFLWPKGAGRGRYVAPDTRLAQSITQSRTLDGLDELTRERRQFAQGTHEPITCFRDPATGEIGIPPDPSLVPEGMLPFTVSSLAEADRVSAEMSAQLDAKFRDEGHFTEMMEGELGNPRSQLVTRMMQTRSQFERDVIKEAIRDLDETESRRQRESRGAAVRFHYRDHDR